MKLKTILLSALLLTSIGNAQKINNSKTATDGRESGFYYYDDYSNEDNETKPIKKKIRATPAEQMQGEMMQQLIKEMQINNVLQAKILEKLEYAYPRTIPEYTINRKTGEKCKSNSSVDCFVMPVITEAQNSVPVMAEMLRNPTSQNVKNYLEWQSEYFNQAFKVGQGFSLVNKQYEREINKVDGMSYTQRPSDANLQNDVAYIKKSLVVKKLGKKLGLLVFVGKSRELERNFSGKEYTTLLSSQFGKMENLAYVYDNQDDKNFVEARINRFGKDTSVINYSKVKTIVDHNQYERFKINATPSAVLVYTKDDGSIIWQKTGYAINSKALLRTTYRFLQFNGIIKPGTINEKDGWEMVDDLREDGDFTQKQIDSIKFDESSINVTDDQYLKKN